MRSIKLFIPFLFVGLVTFTSCHKKETVEVDNETQSVVDNAVAEQEFMAMVPAVNNMAIKTKGTGAAHNRMAAPCDELVYISGDTTFANLNSPPIFSVSIANSTCTPFIPDAKIREGVMTFTLYGRVKTPGSRIKIVMQNYKAANTDPNKKISYICDSIVLKTLVNEASPKVREFNMKIYNGKCIGANNGWTTLYSVDRTIRHEDAGDVIKIWGTSNGTNRENRKFTVEVAAGAPLVKRGSCQFISSGILNLTPEGFKTRTVDYTSGTGVDACDENATFSVNGNTVAFKLK